MIAWRYIFFYQITPMSRTKYNNTLWRNTHMLHYFLSLNLFYRIGSDSPMMYYQFRAQKAESSQRCNFLIRKNARSNYKKLFFKDGKNMNWEGTVNKFPTDRKQHFLRKSRPGGGNIPPTDHIRPAKDNFLAWN